MTSTINDLTTLVSREARVGTIRETIDVVVLVVLIVLVAQAELRRAFTGPGSDPSQSAFSVAIRPLFVVFVAVIVGRMLEIR